MFDSKVLFGLYWSMRSSFGGVFLCVYCGTFFLTFCGYCEDGGGLCIVKSLGGLSVMFIG